MLYILAAIFLWSSLGIVIRLSGLPVHLLIFFSCLISSCLIGLAFTKRKYRRHFPARKNLLPFLILGPLSLLNTFCFFYAYQNTTVANAVLTHYTAPIFVAFLAPVFLRERLTARIFLSVAVATAGLWILLGLSPGQFLTMLLAGDKDTGGILAGLFSGLAYAVLLIVLRKFAKGYHPLVLAFFQNFVIAALLLPFAEAPGNLRSALWAFGIMGIVHSTIAPVLYLRGLKEVTANKAAILGYLEPVCAIILGALFLGEGLHARTAVGGALILFSGYLTIKDSAAR